MSRFEVTTLWRVSSFERIRQETGTSAYTQLDGPTLLPTTLLSELNRLEKEGTQHDVMEIVAACMRHHEPALLCLKLDDVVVPLTIFPAESLYHCPQDLLQDRGEVLTRITAISTEPPGVRPPGHFEHERIGHAEHYRPLLPLLFSLALNGNRSSLLGEIAGAAAYRATCSLADDGLPAHGALASAAEALTRETVSLRTIAAWPGMSLERARRLLNGLYLVSGLRVTRGHPAARAEPMQWLSRLGGNKPRR